MLTNTELVSYIDSLLEADRFKDYSINGLQVEGRMNINKIVTSTTASLDAINVAIENGADALLVHHGLLWRGAPSPLVGVLKERYKLLLEHDINLIAYHLPLDANMEFGNNRYLCNLVGIEQPQFLEKENPQSIGMIGSLNTPESVKTIAQKLSSKLKAPVTVLGCSYDDALISNIAVCSGSGSFILDDNPKPQFDALITGDVKEQTFHLASETNVPVFAVGHHASEQGGIENLGKRIAADKNIEVIFKSFTVEADLKVYEIR